MAITAKLLDNLYTSASLQQCELYLPYILEYGNKYEINSNKRWCHFLAQLGHESGELKYVKEIWGNTPDQRGYEGRKDLGNNQPGDGYKYRGHGLIQLTGRANFKAFSAFAGVDFVSHPELVATPKYAALAAFWFWNSRNLSKLADQDNLKAITKRINGGYNGLADRQRLLSKAKKMMPYTI